MTFETADDVLEHFGVKGMKWGVRKSRAGRAGASVVRTAKAHPKATKRIAAGALFAASVLGGAAAGRAQGRKGMISIRTHQHLSNDRAARLLIDRGARFTRSSTDMELLFNSARHIREGLTDDFLR